MAVEMCEAVGLPTDHIIRDTSSQFAAQRPQDAHLDSTKLENLGICHRRLFQQHVRECIIPHL